MLTFALDRHSDEPLYQQLKNHLLRQIENGILSPGDRLPPTRELADKLAIGRISVITAYEELKAEGYLKAITGRGTFVAEDAPTADPGTGLTGTAASQGAALRDLLRLADRPGLIDFSRGTPADSFLPVDLIRAALHAVLDRDGAEAIAYEAPEGYLPLREAIAQIVGRMGITVDSDEVLITGGCQQALDLAVQALLNPGDVLLTTNPTYPGMLDIAQTRGVIPVGVPVDRQGMQTDLLESLIIEHRPRLIYVAPTYHNPTGTVMPIHRRRHLLELARRYHLPVLEDGVYEELVYQGTPPPPLKALDDQGLVLYASSFSKVFLPGIRIGYLLAGKRLYRRVARVKSAADICTPALNQRAVHALLESGQLAAHLAAVNVVCRDRRDALLEALRAYLPDMQWHAPEGGLYLWGELPPDGPTAIELYMQAVQAGVAFVPGPLFYTGNQGARYLRLNIITYPPDQITEGIRRLSAAWHDLSAGYRPTGRSAGPFL